LTQPQMPAGPGGSDQGDRGMTNSVPSPHRPAPGYVARPRAAAEQIGWMRWLPGLQTLRQYQVAWLRHDILAGLVLTTMLVPVGIAYAVASGVPGIYGLYATIVPLLAYALFGPSRILVPGQHDGGRVRDPVHPGRRGTPGIHHRAAFQADSLRVHERHRADGIDQPTAHAVRLVDRGRRTADELMCHRHSGAGWNVVRGH
jgi:hypothetical protein